LASSTATAGNGRINSLKLKGIYHEFPGLLRHPQTFHYTFRKSAVRAERGRDCSLGALGMREWLLLTTIMVLGFAFTLGKLAYDEWRIKRRNPRAGS
jgi:hypothetical protein